MLTTSHSSFCKQDKFLVDHEGNPYKRFVPTVAPMDMVEDIESLLNKKDGGQ
jgi:glutathione peroxidase-family protein